MFYWPDRRAALGLEWPNLRMGNQPGEGRQYVWSGGQTALGQERPNLRLGGQPVECLPHWHGRKAAFGQERPNLRLGGQPVGCTRCFWFYGQAVLGLERPN